MGLEAADSGFKCDSCCVRLARVTLRCLYFPRKMDIRLSEAGVPLSRFIL